MIFKHRTESDELKIFKALNARLNLSEKDRQYFYRLKKGYEGEVMFDVFTEKLLAECCILNDLLFKVNNTTFQIDSLIIISGKIHIYEIKNLEGDYLYDADSDSLYKLPKKEYNNPLYQIKRSESLLRQLLHSIGYPQAIEASIVFINPEFTLYQAPLIKQFIFSTQVRSYFQKLDVSTTSINNTDRNLANKLVSLHIEKSPYTQLPAYKYDQLKKGVHCRVCFSFSIFVLGQKCVCDSCGHEEKIETAIVRTINELKLLIPDWKITNSGVIEWCDGVINCRKRVSRILRKNFKPSGELRWTIYE